MTLAPRLKPIKVTGLRPCGRRDTGVCRGILASSSKASAPTRTALALSSLLASRFVNHASATPGWSRSSEVLIRTGRALIHAGTHLPLELLPPGQQAASGSVNSLSSRTITQPPSLLAQGTGLICQVADDYSEVGCQGEEAEGTPGYDDGYTGKDTWGTTVPFLDGKVGLKYWV